MAYPIHQMTTQAQALRNKMIAAAKDFVSADAVRTGWSREARDLAREASYDAFIGAEAAYEIYMHGGNGTVACVSYALQRAKYYATLSK